MKKILARQWLIYLGCVFIATIVDTHTLYFDNQQDILQCWGPSFIVGIFVGIFFYSITIPIQITIWALNSNPIISNFLKELFKDCFSFPLIENRSSKPMDDQSSSDFHLN